MTRLLVYFHSLVQDQHDHRQSALLRCINGWDTIDYRGRAQAFAQARGSMFLDGGMNGHPGPASMLGVCPEGLVYFGQFLATLRS